MLDHDATTCHPPASEAMVVWKSQGRHAPGEPSQATITISLPIQPLGWTLSAGAACIALVGCAVNSLLRHFPADWNPRWRSLLARFDLEHEPSLCAWFSTSLLLACAAALACIAVTSRQQGRPRTIAWFALALLFVGLSIDEAIMVHEMADNTLREWLKTSGPLYYPWVIPGFVFASVVGIASLRFLWSLPARTRNRMLLAAALFVGGALGMEIAGTSVALQMGVESAGYIASTTREELLEMLGAICFLSALLDYQARELALPPLHATK